VYFIVRLNITKFYIAFQTTIIWRNYVWNDMVVLKEMTYCLIINT